MVKSVLADETQLKLVEDRLSRSSPPAEVGLVIGKLNSALDRGFVYNLVPTPPNDAGEPACSLIGTAKDDKKKAPKSKSQSTSDSPSLAIDKDWVAEHARQVSRMLVGGIKVVGIYIWANDIAVKNSTMVLCQSVKGVAEAASILETNGQERLLIHICYSPSRWSCRNCMLSSNITTNSLRPCEFKMGRVLSSLHTFKCTYKFDLRLPVYHGNASKFRTMSDMLHHRISIHAKELKDAKAVIDGNLVLGDEACLSDGLNEVQLLLPFMQDGFVEECSQKDIFGVLVFSGSVYSFAHLSSKEPVSQAVEDIKEDILASLRSRLDIICDEADQHVAQAADSGEGENNELSTQKPVSHLDLHLLRERCNLSFPRRVFIPWLAGTYICDYLQPYEKVEVVSEHCAELMSMEAPTDFSTILEPESEAPPLTIKGSIWDAAMPFSSVSDPLRDKDGVLEPKAETNRKATKSGNVNVMAAVFILLLALIVGLVLFVIRAYKM